MDDKPINPEFALVVYEARIEHLLAERSKLGNEVKRLDGLASQYAEERDAALLQNEELQKEIKILHGQRNSTLGKCLCKWCATEKPKCAACGGRGLVYVYGQTGELPCNQCTPLKRKDETLTFSGCGHVLKAKDALCPICGV